MDLLDLVEAQESPVPRSIVRGMGDLERYGLANKDSLLLGKLPWELMELPFGALWALHPADYPRIEKYNTCLPRWQQAYGRDYFHNEQVLDIPDELRPFLRWARLALAPWMNGLLVNWYDGDKGHYIGRHRDSTSGLVVNSPIVVLSLGATRTFRLRKGGDEDKWDIEVSHGTVLLIPWETNRRYTHEVPALARRYGGRRISITLRAFK